MTTLRKGGSGNGPKSDPKSGPLRGGQVSENTRKTIVWLISDNLEDPFRDPFRGHFWITSGVMSFEENNGNEESGEPGAKEMDSDP